MRSSPDFSIKIIVMIDYRLHRQESKFSRLSMLLVWFDKYWFQAVIVLLLLHLCLNREVQISVGAKEKTTDFIDRVEEKVLAQPVSGEANQLTFDPLSLLPEELLEDKPAHLESKWKSSDFRNLTFVLAPEMAKRKNVPAAIVREKMQACRDYVKHYAATAMAEMEIHGIPASITLAQGLLETDAGGSRLATESNNHFGIKCRTKCRGCTCRNYSDDDVYDMFRVFDTAWESFREHSNLLSIPRYKHLKKLGTSDYKGWAAGLKKAGYATDKNYDQKVVQIIEELDLAQFDK